MTSYSDAGVDVAAGDRFAGSIADDVTSTWGSNVVGRFGSFAAGVTIPDGYAEPVLMMTTDGVGTKAELAREHGIIDGLGFDLVAMCVDDLAALGAAPLGITDYLAVGTLDEHRDRALVASVAAACRQAGCALLGGETAVHPGVMALDQFDLAGSALGVVERRRIPDPGSVAPGSAIVGLASPNVRSNGFSLIRSVFSPAEYNARPDGLGGTLIAELLSPSVIYAQAVLAAIDAAPVVGMAHITGGGLIGNLPRMLPPGLTARIDRSTWTQPPVFEVIAARGVDDAEMWSTFNMGIGFAMCVEASRAGEIIAALADLGHEAFVVGVVVAGSRVEVG